MKLSKTIIIGLISLVIILFIGFMFINSNKEANKLEQDNLLKKVDELEQELEKQNDEKKEVSDKNEDEDIVDKEATDNDESKDNIGNSSGKISAMDMYKNAINEHSHLAVNRFFNYYMAVYETIENNYNNYSAKDMYEVSDKFLNDLYGDIKDNGGLSDELVKEQREWVDFKVKNFNKSDYEGLYRYTMDRCHNLIEMYK